MGLKHSKSKHNHYSLQLNINNSDIIVNTNFIKKVFNDGTSFYYFDLPYHKHRDIIQLKCDFTNYKDNKSDQTNISLNNGKAIIINNKKYLEYSNLGYIGLFTLRFSDTQRKITLIYREYS